MSETTDLESHCFARGDDLEPDVYPMLGTLSAAFMFQALPHPLKPLSPPEYVYFPMKTRDLATWGRLTQWNMAWEAGAERNVLFWRRLPRSLQGVRRSEADFRFVPLSDSSRQAAWAPLYHLLPLGLLRQHGLPALRRGVWPCLDLELPAGLLPADHEERMSVALGRHLWPLLLPRSRPADFLRTDPIRLLAHNLDFWLPYVDVVIQRRMRALGSVEIESEEQRQLIQRLQADAPPGVEVSRPYFGGYAWVGEDEAWEAATELVEAADQHGRLRAIMDAVSSSRVEEDFSARWSFLREDFERKLYRKRSRVRISFVELDETAPVIGPTSEIAEGLLWQDLMGLVDIKDRRVVVLLRSGVTRATEIAGQLGYANHSPISKALARIRRKAAAYLGIN